MQNQRLTCIQHQTTTQVSNGLVLPYAAVAVAGRGGAIGVLLITFMAVTSTISAQIIAVSSIITFDIYRTYIHPRATDADVIRWSHIGVILFGVFSGAFSTALYYGKVDLGWTLYMLGVLTCPGIFPTTFTILWKKQSRLAAVVSPLLGLVTGLAVWLGSASSLYGEVTVASTGKSLPCVYGTVASAFSPALYSVMISLARPANFDWADFRKEKLLFDDAAAGGEGEIGALRITHDVEVSAAAYSNDKARLKRWGFIASAWALATFLGHWVLWYVSLLPSSTSTLGRLSHTDTTPIGHFPCTHQSTYLARVSSSPGWWCRLSGSGGQCLWPASTRSSMVGSRLPSSFVGLPDSGKTSHMNTVLRW